MMKNFMVITLISVFAGSGALGQDSVAKPVDYGRLTVDNMPPIQMIVKQASEASTSGEFDVDAEIKNIYAGNLLPRFRVQTGATSISQNQYGYRELNSEFNYHPANDPGALHTSTYEGRTTPYGVQGAETQLYPNWYVQAKWSLHKLVLDREEFYVREINARARYYKKGTIDNVVSAYSNLMELLLEKVPGDSDPYLERDIIIAAAEIDFLTGYFLTDTIKKLPDEPVVKKNPETVPRAKVDPVEAPQRTEKKKKLEVDPLTDPTSPLYEIRDLLPDAPVEDSE